MVNEQGGIAGRQINFITYDDGFSPPKTVEQVRRLVEQDKVAFLFNTLGTPTNSAIVRYVNQRKVPHLFLATGADKWGDYQDTPWTMGWQPSYRTEAQIYAKHMLRAEAERSSWRCSTRTTISARTTSPACGTCWAASASTAWSAPPPSR